MVKNYTEVIYDNQIINTERLILRKFRKEDAVDMLEYGSDPEVLKYLIWEGIKTIDEALVAIVEYHWEKPSNYAIELKENNKCIGGIDLRIKPAHEKASFGYVLNRFYWGKGYMTEALTAILHLAFDKLELNRVEGGHYVGNEGSGKVMEKSGMLLEGKSPRSEKIKGVFQDLVHYGIIKEHWDMLKNPNKKGE